MLTDFPGRHKGENVLMVIRKHPIVYARILFVFTLVVILPLVVFFFLWASRYPLFGSEITGIVGYLAASLYLLYSLAMLLIAWLDEEFDLFILTNHRLIDITQITFLRRSVATTPLDQIQDTTSHIEGVVATILNYGTIDVQTAAGDASNFTIDRVPNPTLVARKILTYAEEKKGRNYVDPEFPKTMEELKDSPEKQS